MKDVCDGGGDGVWGGIDGRIVGVLSGEWVGGGGGGWGVGVCVWCGGGGGRRERVGERVWNGVGWEGLERVGEGLRDVEVWIIDGVGMGEVGEVMKGGYLSEIGRVGRLKRAWGCLVL